MTDRKPAPWETPLDSKLGCEMLMVWARAHRMVLNQFHRELAEKYEVSTEGVRFSDAIPFHTLTKDEALAMYPPSTGEA